MNLLFSMIFYHSGIWKCMVFLSKSMVFHGFWFAETMKNIRFTKQNHTFSDAKVGKTKIMKFLVIQNSILQIHPASPPGQPPRPASRGQPGQDQPASLPASLPASQPAGQPALAGCLAGWVDLGDLGVDS